MHLLCKLRANIFGALHTIEQTECKLYFRFTARRRLRLPRAAAAASPAPPPRAARRGEGRGARGGPGALRASEDDVHPGEQARVAAAGGGGSGEERGEVEGGRGWRRGRRGRGGEVVPWGRG